MILSHYQHYINQNNIKDIADVRRELIKLNSVLPKTDLQNLLYFNLAYVIITDEVQRLAKKKTFANPQQMNELDVTFASYYFQALNQYSKTGNLPEPWAQVIAKQRPASIYLLLGANAHINHDLPLALNDTFKTPGEVIKKDFLLVGQIFMPAGKKISTSYEEPNSMVNFGKKRLGIVLVYPIIRLILRWRHQAWKNFELLNSKSLKPLELVSLTKQIANSLLLN